ncbi:hypothetical protein K501DRAFT_266038 [Backusella circina FSU 941]|nr:hypothetical protein K501DRAFT_266038 [Backusella circina FSU 941]
MRSSFDVSAKCPFTCMESWKKMKQHVDESLMSFAYRFATAMKGACREPSQQTKPVCMMFIVSLLSKYKELVSDGLKKAYKDKNGNMDLDDSKVDTTEHVLLFFSELQDFCATTAEEIEVTVQEFKKLETFKKRVLSDGQRNHNQSNKAFKSNSRANPRNSSSPSTSKIRKPAKNLDCKCRFYPLNAFNFNDTYECPGRLYQGKKKDDTGGLKPSKDRMVNFVSTTAKEIVEQFCVVEAVPMGKQPHALDYYLSNSDHPYDSDLDGSRNFDGESDDACSTSIGKMNKICLTVKRSSYTIGDIGNPFKTTDPIMSIILQDIEVTGLLNSGSESSVLYLISTYSTIAGAFLDDTMHIKGVVNLLYDGVDTTMTHQFDVINSSISFGSNQVLIGRDLIPKLGIIPFINVAHRYKNKNLAVPDDSITDKRFEPNVWPADTKQEKKMFREHIFKLTTSKIEYWSNTSEKCCVVIDYFIEIVKLNPITSKVTAESTIKRSLKAVQEVFPENKDMQSQVKVLNKSAERKDCEVLENFWLDTAPRLGMLALDKNVNQGIVETSLESTAATAIKARVKRRLEEKSPRPKPTVKKAKPIKDVYEEDKIGILEFDLSLLELLLKGMLLKYSKFYSRPIQEPAAPTFTAIPIRGATDDSSSAQLTNADIYGFTKISNNRYYNVYCKQTFDKHPMKDYRKPFIYKV